MVIYLRILIAEDEKIERDYLKMMIEKADLPIEHIYTAANGQEAIQIYSEHPCDIILMDINMPVMDGYEATKEIRKYSAKVPIIAITAFAYASDEQRVMASGFDGYMPQTYQCTVA